MAIDGVNADYGPLMMTKMFAAEAGANVARAAASQGTQQLLARGSGEAPPAVERKAMQESNQRNTLTGGTYSYDASRRSVGATTTTGDRVGMFVNTFA